MGKTKMAARHILLESGQSQQKAQGKNSNYGLSSGVGVSIGAQTGIYAYVEVGGGKGKNKLDANTHSDTTLQSQQLILKSKGDTTLRGAQAGATRIDADIGGKLNIESPQDSIEQMHKQSSAGLRVQVSWGTAWSVGGNFSSENAEGSLLSVNRQSGLFAGEGGYHIKAGQVRLKGGAIASTAEKDHNELNTGSLTFENRNNHRRYRADSVSLSGSYSSDSPGQNPDNAAFRDSKAGQLFARSAGDEPGFSYSPGLPQHESGTERGTTYATLSPGRLTIGGQETNVETLGIHSDAATAHQAVNGLPDLQQMLAKQKTVAEATATIASAVRSYSSSRAKAAEKEQTQARQELQAALDSGDSARLAAAQNRHTAAERNAKDWGIGGTNSRALGAATTLITGALSGQTELQVAANTLAPYAAASIGKTFGPNGSDPNKAAQLISHAVLGATLAYANGGNATSGAVAGAGSEAVAMYLTETLYKAQATDRNGVFDPNRLPEEAKEEIKTLSALISSIAGGVTGGSVSDAQTSGVIGQNAVENNALSAFTEDVNVAEKELNEACSSGGAFNFNDACQKTYNKWMAISSEKEGKSPDPAKWASYAKRADELFAPAKAACKGESFCLNQVSQLQLNAVVTSYGYESASSGILGRFSQGLLSLSTFNGVEPLDRQARQAYITVLTYMGDKAELVAEGLNDASKIASHWGARQGTQPNTLGSGVKSDRSHGSRSQNSSKNERHGDGGRALSAAEKQIEQLEKLKIGLPKKEQAKIDRKIRNIRMSAQQKAKGEEHSRAAKR